MQVDQESRLSALRNEEGFAGQANRWGKGVAVGRNKRGLRELLLGMIPVDCWRRAPAPSSPTGTRQVSSFIT